MPSTSSCTRRAGRRRAPRHLGRRGRAGGGRRRHARAVRAPRRAARLAARARAVSGHVVLAFCAGAIGVAAAARSAASWRARCSRAQRASSARCRRRWMRSCALGREGREPGAVERRQLLACGAVAAFCAATLLAGPLAGAALALAAPLAVSRALRARRLAYRRAVERDAPAIALAVADALSGGRSLRGALLDAPDHARRRGRRGDAAGGGRARRRAAHRRRARGAAASLPVAHDRRDRGGGARPAPLGRQPRACCFAGSRARSRTSSASPTRCAWRPRRRGSPACLVVVLPLGGALLAELASPGLVAGLAASPVTAWLVAARALAPGRRRRPDQAARPRAGVIVEALAFASRSRRRPLPRSSSAHDRRAAGGAAGHRGRSVAQGRRSWAGRRAAWRGGDPPRQARAARRGRGAGRSASSRPTSGSRAGARSAPPRSGATCPRCSTSWASPSRRGCRCPRRWPRSGAARGRRSRARGAGWGRRSRSGSRSRPRSMLTGASSPCRRSTRSPARSTRAARHGAPLAETLAAQAREVRLARRRAIQEEAARAGPKMQLVVALLLVPSVMLLVAAALAQRARGGGAGRALTGF